MMVWNCLTCGQKNVSIDHNWSHYLLVSTKVIVQPACCVSAI